MKKLLKNKLSEAKGAASKYTAQQLITVCVVSFFMVLVSASAVFGLNTNQDVLASKQESIAEAYDNMKLEKAINESDQNDEEVAEPIVRTHFINEDKVSDPNAAAFNIGWYQNYDSLSAWKTTPVYYEDLDTGDDIQEPFCKTDIRRDSIQNTSNSDRDFGIASAAGYRQSQFDVRYFEDCYETADGQHIWAYAGSFLQLKNGTADPVIVNCTKFGFYYNGSNWRLWYINELDGNGSWKDYESNITANYTIDLHLRFKDMYGEGSDAIDWHAWWGATHTWNETPNLLVQYMCNATWSDDEGEHQAYIHTNPPFAADLNMRDTQDRTLTFSNYTGRYSTTTLPDESGTKVNSVYSQAVITPAINYYVNPLAPPEEREKNPKIPEGIEEEDLYSYIPWVYDTAESGGTVKTVVYNTENKRWDYTLSTGGTKQLKDFQMENGKYKVVDGQFVFDENTNYEGTQVWANLIYTYNEAKVSKALDSSSLGVTINMYDYDAWHARGNTPYFYGGINSRYYTDGETAKREDYSYHFTYGSETGLQAINQYNENTTQKIWKNLISDTYPEVVETFNSRPVTGNIDLSHLFIGTNPFRRSYTNLNGLFDADIYNTTGYFFYSSSDYKISESETWDGHFAQIRKRADEDMPTETLEKINSAVSNDAVNDFVLYDDPWDVGDEAWFMPFNDHGATSTAGNDYHFGCTIKTLFLQPPDGKSTEGIYAGNSMVFYFQGDDDVFVYNDDVLMLDLGGIHQSVAGQINYHTGQILVKRHNGTTHYEQWMDDRWWDAKKAEMIEKYDDVTTSTTLAQFFDKHAADEGWEKAIVEDEETGEMVWNNHYRYKDYSSHEMKFYYFERGLGHSNCTIAFNLQSMPEGTIYLAKQIEENTETPFVGHLDGDFHYCVEVKKCIDPDHPESEESYGPWEKYEPAEDGSIYYKVYQGMTGMDDKNLVGTFMPDNNGIVHIRENQHAFLYGFNDLDKFKIAECDPGGTIIADVKVLWDRPKVSLSGGDAKDTKDLTFEWDTQKNTWYGTDELQAGPDKVNSVIFINYPNADSLFNLRIKKRECNNDESNIYVGFNDLVNEKGEIIGTIPYEGKYDLHKTDGTVLEDQECNEGKIVLKDNEWIEIHRVQLETKVTVEDQDNDTVAVYYIMKTELAPTSFQAGQMCQPNPDTPGELVEGWNKYNSNDKDGFSARIPFVNPPSSVPEAGRYGQIDFVVRNLMSNLVLKKIVEDTETEPGRTYDIGLTLYKNSAEPLVPYSSDDTFTAYLYSDEANEPVKYDAKIVDGSIKIRVADTEGDFVNTKLKKDEYLEIENILPTDAETTSDKVKCYIANEEVIADCTPTAYLDDVSTSAHEMNEIKDGYKYSTQIDTDSASKDTIIIKNKFGDVPPTAYNIVKHPELWTLLLAAVILAALAVPIQILRKYKAKMVYNNLPTLKIGVDKFDIGW